MHRSASAAARRLVGAILLLPRGRNLRSAAEKCGASRREYTVTLSGAQLYLQNVAKPVNSPDTRTVDQFPSTQRTLWLAHQ